MEHIIEVKGLKKSYGNIPAVKDLSFYVEKGKLFAFLGPNGAGKSTTINSICTFLMPDAGVVEVDGYVLGKEDDRIRESIGIVFQESLMDELLTVEENLMLRARFYPMKKKERIAAVKRAAEVTEITGIMNRYYGRLSGGQKRRADIARALLHTPKVLFLDEPTTGLDSQTRKSVWDTIKRLKEEQEMTVFLTTHYLEEAEDADYCMVVDDGKIAARGTPFSLKAKYAKDKLRVKCREEEKVKEKLLERGISFEKKGELLEVCLANTMEALPILNECRELIGDFSVIRGSMDDVFIGITGKELRE
ncbi:multidrug/hemolysin transport system ATP-binding protein [Kineothrix alysoides]|uniref:Multidrug/hemolysin transport system ATP-binding protein n=1 Tax=Kineothrix alysoides TaxID=1469948 RepID=A0A4R1R148_9FIRM|nr:ABC transporter ATP-binding protein [Kineothrix alysoides]TCL59034.1 multidrug/hemolysin transport system ATP-binding protein [Kineothrix alysoides]